VRFDIISDFGTAVDLADKILQTSGKCPEPNDWELYYGISGQWKLYDDGITAKFMVLFDGYRKVFEQSISKSKDLGDILRILPGVVVQRGMSMQGMADLYKIKPDLLEGLIKSTFELIKLDYSPNAPDSRGYKLSSLSGFLHFDPVLQHISICRHVLSLLDRPNASDLQS
jgi:hypothetical protein